MKGYWFLAVAIACEVVATTTLKKTDQFTRLLPSLVVAIGYLAAFYFLTKVLETIPIGVTYATWSGLGIVFVAVAAAILYRQIPDLPAVIGMGLIIAGVGIMNLLSKTIGH
jgi:small multidrug resistance pump